MDLGLRQIVTKTRTGELRPSVLVREALAKAARAGNLNIFTEILEKAALEQAASLEEKIKSGQPLGRLAGVVFCVKDNFLLKDTKTSAAAPFLLDFTAPYTSTCLQRLLNEDAILIGKTNLDAFAHGTSTENSYFGPTRNPADTARTPGGSSGGSAAAVAAGICPLALGTDTGGSVRLPASFCGVYGFKPTYGLLSRYGVVAMASSTDCVAPLTRTPTDAAYVMEVMRGRDPHDGTTFDDGDLAVDARPPATPPQLGVIKQFRQNLDAEVSEAFEAAVAQLVAAGWQVKEVSMPSIGLALACYYVLVSAEVSSNLSRYDGLRYGKRLKGSDWEAAVARSRSSGFMAENKRRIMLGTYVLSQGYYEAYYQKAQRLRTLLCAEFADAFKQADALISPVSPATAFELGEKTADPIQMYLADLMTVAPSLAGIPASSLPLPSRGLPSGLQVMTPRKTDRLNLEIGEGIASLL